MSFLDQIENVQKKPEHARQKIALASAIFFTLMLVVLWLSFADLFSPINKQANNDFDLSADGLRGTATAAKPILDQIKESFDQMKNYTELVQRQTASSSASTSQQQTNTEEEIVDEEMVADEITTPPEVLRYLENATLNQ